MRALSAESSGQHEIGPIHVLLVEDNLGDAILAEETLSRLPGSVSITRAENGKEALQALATQPNPDLILLDLGLPLLSGEEVLSIIDRDEQLSKLRIAILSGQDQGAITGRLKRPLLSKPLSIENLEATLAAFENPSNQHEQETARRPTPLSSELEAEFGAFASMAGHDLAASFRHVSAFLSLLAESPDLNLSEKQASYLSRAQAAASKSTGLLDDLRTISRIQRTPPQLHVFPAARAFLAAQTPLTQHIRDTRTHIEIENLPDIVADERLLRDVGTHVLHNAVVNTPPNEAPHIHISDASDADAWRIHVRDHGVGLDEAEFEKVFNFGYRLPTPERPEARGTGLTIARRIARRHGGNIRFMPTQSGACVEIALPRRQPQQDATTW